jgi:hypothetical protein
MVNFLQQHKTLAIVVVLILVLLLYLRFSANARKEKALTKKGGRGKGKGTGRAGKGKGKEKATNKKKAGKAGKSGKASKTTKETGRASKSKDDDSDESGSAEDDDLREDAEELYNLVHEGMCSGMQQSEFEQAVDDLADAFVFIELKQIYRQCMDKNMDPERAITVDDYVRILKKED